MLHRPPVAPLVLSFQAPPSAYPLPSAPPPPPCIALTTWGGDPASRRRPARKPPLAWWLLCGCLLPPPCVVLPPRMKPVGGGRGWRRYEYSSAPAATAAPTAADVAVAAAAGDVARAAAHFRPLTSPPHAHVPSPAAAASTILPPSPLPSSSSSSSASSSSSSSVLPSACSLGLPPSSSRAFPAAGPQHPPAVPPARGEEKSRDELRWEFMQARATSVGQPVAKKKEHEKQKIGHVASPPPAPSPPFSPPFRSIHLDYVPPRPPMTLPCSSSRRIQPALSWTAAEIDEWWQLYEIPRGDAAGRREQRRLAARQRKSARTGLPIQPPREPLVCIQARERKRRQKLQTLRQRAPTPLFTIRILLPRPAPLTIRVLHAPLPLPPPRFPPPSTPLACSPPSPRPLSPLVLPLISLCPPRPASASPSCPSSGIRDSAAVKHCLQPDVQRPTTARLQHAPPPRDRALPLHLQRMLLRTLSQLAPYLLHTDPLSSPPFRPRIAA